MARKKLYDDDDGRTIADMSGVSPSRPFFPPRKSHPAPAEPVSNAPDRPWEPSGEQLSKEDRRVYIFAALRAALLIAAVFICGLGLATWLLLKLWT